MRPHIGLNTAILDGQDPLKAKALCHLKYIDAIAGAGGIPIVIPPYTDSTMLEDILPTLQGFLFIGGPDYLPEAYGGHAQPPNELMHPRRHSFDLRLAEMVLKNTAKPVLGICGGHQLINISFGGGLVQDLQSEWKPLPQQASTLLHADAQRKDTPQQGDVYRHEVRLGHTSLIAQIVGSQKVLTNSYHHQAIDPKRIGTGLVASAWSPDGVIEAVELQNRNRFLVGVQWHPERQFDEAPHRALFEALVNAS